MLFSILFLGTLVIVFYYFVHLPYQYWKNKNVPHPPISYLFGNFGDVILLKKCLRRYYYRMYNKYPDLPYYGFYRLQTPCILIRDPELIKEVIIKSFNSFHDNDIHISAENDPLFAKHPLVTKGHLWKEVRNQSAPLFTPYQIKKMFPILEKVTKCLLVYINSHVVERPEGVDAKEMSLKYTTDIVANAALGLEANSFTTLNSEYIKNIKKIVSPSFFNNLTFLLVFNFPFLAKLLKFKFVPSDASMYYTTIVNETLQYRIQNQIQRDDFLGSMYEIQQKLGVQRFTNEHITAHVLSVFIDGTESSAIVLAFALYELALNYDIQEKLSNEVEDTMQKYEGKITYEVLEKMEYLDKILKENLRKNTPFPVMNRMCTEKIKLESPHGAGEDVTIVPGTPIVIPVHSIHHDPKYYPNPSLFDPTRFTEDNIDNRPKYTYLPFGEGPRICIGQKFGLTQIKLALVYIIKNYVIRINKDTIVPYKIDPQYFILSAVGGIKINFYNRH